MFEVRTIKEARPYVERPLLRMPDWHSCEGRNIFDRQDTVKRQCRHISDTFREIIFKYDDISATRLVVATVCGLMPLTAEALPQWLSNFYALDGYFEEEQAQRLWTYLVSDESSLQFVN